MRKLLLGLVILFLCAGCGFFRKPPKLVCYCEARYLQDTIRQMFDADTVLLYSKLLAEEPYFPEVRAITACVVNGTTHTLDFKTLPEKHERFDNYSRIEYELKKEAEKVAELLFEQCDTKEFNEIIIEFFRYDKDGKPEYRFISHHDKMFGPDKTAETKQ